MTGLWAFEPQGGSASVKVVVLLAVRADETLIFGLAPLRLGYFCRVNEMAAGALDGLKIGRTGFEPVGEKLRKHAPASTKRTDGVEPLKNGVADKRRLVGYFVQNLGQVLIHTEGYHCLFRLVCHMSNSFPAVGVAGVVFRYHSRSGPILRV